jgi:ABC-type multidrug transport system fused ATPase/permease subunit
MTDNVSISLFPICSPCILDIMRAVERLDESLLKIHEKTSPGQCRLAYTPLSNAASLPPWQILTDSGNDGFGFSVTNLRMSSGSHAFGTIEQQGETSLHVSAVPTSDLVADDVQADLGTSQYFVDIRFQNLGLKLKKDKRVVLDGVTGQLLHGRVCAVMGPSGAGKSTFITALCGKASYGTLSGSVYINGQKGLLTDQKYRTDRQTHRQADHADRQTHKSLNSLEDV